MTSEKFERHVEELLKAIELCLKSKFHLPGLILLYATIDIMAWLNRPKSHADVKRHDFLLWVEKYLLPSSGLTCTAIDLYAARCSLLHTYTAESRLSRKGKAREILYAWGIGQAQCLQKAIDSIAPRRAVAVHIEKLFYALQQGIKSFKEDLSNNPRQAEIVYGRVGKKYFDQLSLNLTRILNDIE